MKKIIISTVLLCFCSTTTIFAQTDAEMKAWMDYMTPGDVHKMIAKSDGDWKGEVTMWMDPTKPPTKSNCTSTNKMIMGGRYQKSSFNGTMMGSPFEGMGLLAYDNAKKEFISTWIDNMGTGIMTLKGTWDDKTKTITFKGDCVDPISGKNMLVREVFQFVDDNTQKMEMYMIQDGKEFKSMEINLTRVI